MHAFAIFAVNEHIAELQAEAARGHLRQERSASNPIVAFVARIARALRAPEAAPSTTLAFFSPVK